MDRYWTLLSFGDMGWGDEIAFGLLVTVSLSLATLPFGLAAGFALALGRQSSDAALRLSAEIYTTIFRGLPELLTLFVVYYGAQSLVSGLTAWLHLPSVSINSFIAGMLALGLVFSAFAGEVFLSAFRAIPNGQREGAMALGLSRRKTMLLVLVPQLVRIALPGLSNLWMNLLKDTALVSTIGLADTLRQSEVAARVTREPFLFFGLACGLYLVLTILSSLVIGGIDRWARRGEARS